MCSVSQKSSKLTNDVVARDTKSLAPAMIPRDLRKKCTCNPDVLARIGTDDLMNTMPRPSNLVTEISMCVVTLVCPNQEHSSSRWNAWSKYVTCPEFSNRSWQEICFMLPGCESCLSNADCLPELGASFAIPALLSTPCSQFLDKTRQSASYSFFLWHPYKFYPQIFSVAVCL